MSNKNDAKVMLTTNQIVARGWTASMTKRFLPEPDKTRINPHYRSGPPIKLWLPSTVEALERRDDVRAAIAKALAERPARQDGARKAVETKEALTLKLVSAVQITVTRIDLDALRKLAIEHRNHYRAHAIETGLTDYVVNPDDATATRWMRNFVRHNCTLYDEIIDDLSGLVGRDEAYRLLRDRVENEISSVYPELADAQVMPLPPPVSEAEALVERKAKWADWRQHKTPRADDD